MFLNEPVTIPEVPGKIVFRKKGENNYVLYEIGRRYDPDRQFNVVQRKMIGIQIPGQPELMLPNENYLVYIGNGEKDITDEQAVMIRNYATERDREKMLRAFFDKAYYEFLTESRKTPEYPVSPEKVKRINRILRPLMEMMENEDYAEFLELIPETEEEEENQLTCSDVAMLLTIFKTAVDRYFLIRI